MLGSVKVKFLGSQGIQQGDSTWALLLLHEANKYSHEVLTKLKKHTV